MNKNYTDISKKLINYKNMQYKSQNLYQKLNVLSKLID